MPKTEICEIFSTHYIAKSIWTHVLFCTSGAGLARPLSSTWCSEIIWITFQLCSNGSGKTLSPHSKTGLAQRWTRPECSKQLWSRSGMPMTQAWDLGQKRASDRHTVDLCIDHGHWFMGAPCSRSAIFAKWVSNMTIPLCTAQEVVIPLWCGGIWLGPDLNHTESHLRDAKPNHPTSEPT